MLIKNFNNIISNLNTFKCFTEKSFFRLAKILNLWNSKSIISNFTFFNTAASATKILGRNFTKTNNNSTKKTVIFSLTASNCFFFEPLEQFEIAAVVFPDSIFFNLYMLTTYNHIIPFILGSFFFLLIFTRFSIYSNLVIINLMFFNLIKNLFSINVPNSAKNQKVFFLFYSVFAFILYHNLTGMAPFTYTVTSLIITSFLLSTSVFFVIFTKNVLQNGWFFFDHFLPVGVNIRGARWMVIIELISFFTRVISLGVRLFANLLSGHILLKVLIGFFLIGITLLGTTGWLLLPGLLVYWIVLFLVTMLEVFIAFLQAYTFVFLTILYFGETTKLLESTSNTLSSKLFFFKPNLFSCFKILFSSKKTNNFLLFLVLNAPVQKQFMFQDAGTEMMEEITKFHNQVMCFLIFIVAAIVYLIFSSVHYFYFHKNDPEVIEYIREGSVTHNPTLETIWTLLPTLVLLIIIVPSFLLLWLGSSQPAYDLGITIKVIGNQWYWTYDSKYDPRDGSTLLADESYIFDSYLTPSKELPKGSFRLFEVSERLVIPQHKKVRFVIMATDVIHSWSVPGLGIKVDACPGRISEVIVSAKRKGVYFGQCSEICGSQHSFMPSVVEVVGLGDYFRWAEKRHVDRFNMANSNTTEFDEYADLDEDVLEYIVNKDVLAEKLRDGKDLNNIERAFVIKKLDNDTFFDFYNKKLEDFALKEDL